MLSFLDQSYAIFERCVTSTPEIITVRIEVYLF